MTRVVRAYDAETIDRGLLMVAVCAGDAAQAHRRLAADGVDVPERTLRDWRANSHAQRFVEVQREFSSQLEGELVEQARASALMASRLEQAALERATAQMLNMQVEPKDPGAVARNAAVTKGINVDQVLKLSGRPTVVTEHRNADDLLDSLAKKLGLALEPDPVDATVVETRELPDGDARALTDATGSVGRNS